MFFKKNTLTIVCIISLLCFSYSIYSADKVITVGIQINQGFPHIMGSGVNLPDPPGIGPSILQEVGKMLDIEFKIVRMPNKRVHKLLEVGKFNASGFYSHSKDREKECVYPKTKDGKLDYSRRISKLGYHFYVLQGSNVRWDGKKPTGINVAGANSGYSVVSNLKKMGLEVFEPRTAKQNLEMLLLGRVQAYAAQSASMDLVIKSYDKYKNVVRLDPEIKSKGYYFVFSHQFMKDAENRKLAEKVWDTIAKVRDSVQEKYRNINLKPPVIE